MRRWLFSPMLLMLVASSPRPAAACEVDTLAWLAGAWAGLRNGVLEEEHWTAPRANVMVGMNRIASESKLREFCFYRIEKRADGVFYLSMPNGASPPTPFKLKECGPSRVVFEKLDHDFPQRIMYHRTHADTMRARIEGMVKGALRSAEWTWTRTTLAP